MARSSSPKFTSFSDKRRVPSGSSARRGTGASPWVGEGIVNWIEKQGKMLRVGIGVGVLVLLLFFVGIFYRTYRQNSGLAKLRSGIVALQSGNTAEAITQLATATGLLSKEERGLALIYLGDAYTRLEKREEAEAAYQELAQRSEGYLTQMALLHLGRNAEGRQDFQLARQCYEKAAALEGPFQSEAVFAVARVLDSGGERSAASAYYERVLTQYPDSPLAEVARQKSGK